MKKKQKTPPPLKRRQETDWWLVLIVITLNIIGLFNLYGVTADAAAWMKRLVWRQLIWSLVGIILMLAIGKISYKKVLRLSVPLYLVSLVLVVLPMILGMRRKGAYSWLFIGGVSIQPSEFAKIALILVLAKFLGQRSFRRSLNIGDYIIAGIIALVPAVIVARQPDLGSAVIFLSIAAVALFLAGMNRRWILILIMAMVVGGVALYPRLKPYQKARIKVFLHPWEDSLDKGYNVVQSEIAIGSGGVVGKGFREGSQTRYRFLPEFYTDFIFAGYIEQFGLVGGIVLLCLFAALIYRLMRIALVAKEPAAYFLVGGGMALIVTHVVLNIGMTMGLLPVTGLPLPWLSYGGSSLMTSYIAMGIALSTMEKGYMF
jgi:rod shape determining protein RodA